MNWKELIWELSGATQEIDSLKAAFDADILEKNRKIVDLQIAIEQSKSADKKTISDLLNQIDALKTSFATKTIIPALPSPFREASDVYKAGFWLRTEQGESYLEPVDAGGHITLTSFLYYIINKANVLPSDDALSAFNKILGAQQEYTTYLLDDKQFGKNHGENWTPAICVLNTKKDDCESLASLCVSAFQYYQLIEGKFPEAYAFVGTGEYAQQYGHGFPCLYLNREGKSFEENLFIGESTLHTKTPAKNLKDCKNIYWCNWGNNSFWHDFRIKDEFVWWKKTAGTAKLPITPEEKEEKQNKIKKFWKTKGDGDARKRI